MLTLCRHLLNVFSYIWKFWPISSYKETELISILKNIFLQCRTADRILELPDLNGRLNIWIFADDYFMRSWNLTLFAVGSPVACRTDARKSPDVISLTSRSVTALVLLVNVTS